MTITSTTSSAGVNVAKVVGEIANGTDTFKKAASVTIDVMSIVLEVLGFVPGAEGVSGIKDGLSLLRDQFKTTKSVINGTALVGMGYEWGDPAMRASNTKTWQKTANRATLTAALVLETIGFIDKYTMRFFSQPSLSVGGSLPIFDLVKNSLYAVSAGFGIWCASMDMDTANRAIDHGSAKKRKWEALSAELGVSELDKFDFDRVVAKYQGKLKALESVQTKDEASLAKTEKYQKYVGILSKKATADDFKAVAQEFQKAKVEDLFQKYADRTEAAFVATGLTKKGEGTYLDSIDSEIALIESDLKTLKGQLETEGDAEKKKALEETFKEKAGKLIALKAANATIEKYDHYLEAITNGQVDKIVKYKIEKADVRIHNGNNLITKSWISIAAEVGKIFMIVVGTILLGLSAVFPVLKGPAVNLTMSACSLVSNTFGLTKNLYRDVFYKANMQKMPQFAAAAA